MGAEQGICDSGNAAWHTAAKLTYFINWSGYALQQDMDKYFAVLCKTVLGEVASHSMLVYYPDRCHAEANRRLAYCVNKVGYKDASLGLGQKAVAVGHPSILKSNHSRDALLRRRF